MVLREGDAWGYLRFKQLFKPSDCNALCSDGRRVPVLIRPDSGQLAVEVENQLFDPKTLPGFTRFELKAEEIPDPPPAAQEVAEAELFEARLKAARTAN